MGVPGPDLARDRCSVYTVCTTAGITEFLTWEGARLSPLDSQRLKMALGFSSKEGRVGRGILAKMYSI